MPVSDFPYLPVGLNPGLYVFHAPISSLILVLRSLAPAPSLPCFRPCTNSFSPPLPTPITHMVWEWGRQRRGPTRSVPEPYEVGIPIRASVRAVVRRVRLPLLSEASTFEPSGDRPRIRPLRARSSVESAFRIPPRAGAPTQGRRLEH